MILSLAESESSRNCTWHPTNFFHCRAKASFVRLVVTRPPSLVRARSPLAMCIHWQFKSWAKLASISLVTALNQWMTSSLAESTSSSLYVATPTRSAHLSPIRLPATTGHSMIPLTPLEQRRRSSPSSVVSVTRSKWSSPFTEHSWSQGHSLTLHKL